MCAIACSFRRVPLNRVSRMVPTWFDTDWVSMLWSVSLSPDGSLPAFVIIAIVKHRAFTRDNPAQESYSTMEKFQKM